MRVEKELEELGVDNRVIDEQAWLHVLLRRTVSRIDLNAMADPQRHFSSPSSTDQIRYLLLEEADTVETVRHD